MSLDSIWNDMFRVTTSQSKTNELYLIDLYGNKNSNSQTHKRKKSKCRNN